jgi:hypothetical protein
VARPFPVANTSCDGCGASEEDNVVVYDYTNTLGESLCGECADQPAEPIIGFPECPYPGCTRDAAYAGKERPTCKYHAHSPPFFIEANHMLEEAQSEAEKNLNNLAKYGCHHDRCAWHDTPLVGVDCDCGLRTALGQPPQRPPMFECECGNRYSSEFFNAKIFNCFCCGKELIGL